MAKSKKMSADDFIAPLIMDGLQGRVLTLPPPKGTKKQILFIYGHHSSLERWWGVVQDLNKYGAVTMPDLPGFGGMDSFYKLGQEATIDNFADYLAAFVKMRYRNRRVSIAGLSFGFVIVTRMLQRYPELVKKVDLLVSVVGFAHKDDFSFSRSRMRFYKYSALLFSRPIPAQIFRVVALNPLVLRLAYAKTHNAKQKFVSKNKQERKKIMNFEVHLWRCNEIRTYMKTTVEFLTLDNCQKQINLPVWHVSVKADRYFDNNVIEQHMRVIFTDFHLTKSRMSSHAPSIIADKKMAAPLLPKKIRSLLSTPE
ncbi:MAG: hypothetical protein NVSMB46_01620 [Candidatus Saccharimonadales bacterium]